MNKAKGRQSTRHKSDYEIYRSRGTRQTNKIAKLRRHIKRYGGNDGSALAALKSLGAKV